ncbi:MAG: DNA polymerase III subunit gamma/tau [Nitrospirae bacterium]|nr:DNA polymerase III subunit gamma/tau [Nitrospirota bacterium]
MAYLVLARKWRPRVFEELAGQEPIARILKNAVEQDKAAHAYIFSGPRGVGKTSAARILAKALNCAAGPTSTPCGECASCEAVRDGSSLDVIEIDGASNTGVDNIRDLREKVRYAPSGSRFKVYIIDEAHMLSTSAFNALLKTLEEPPPHVIFVLATTDPKKIPATVLSRCQHLPFRRISSQKIRERLKFISSAEGIRIDETALEMLSRVADGSMRDSLTILDQIASFSDDITAADVKDLLGTTDIETLSQIASAVIEGDRNTIIRVVSMLVESGADLKAFTKDLLHFIRNLMITKMVGDPEGIIDLSEEELSAINRLKGGVAEEHIAVVLSELIKAEPNIRTAFHPRVALEMSLIRLSLLSHLKSVNEALKSIQGTGTMRQEPVTKSMSPGIMHKKSTNGIKKINDACPDPQLKAQIPLPDMWQAVVERIDEANHPLYCKLLEGDISFGDEEIKIVYESGNSIHADSVKENIPFIKKQLKELYGRDMRINVETRNTQRLSKKDLIEQALDNPVVKEALELFEGRIVDVIPNNTSNNG